MAMPLSHVNVPFIADRTLARFDLLLYPPDAMSPARLKRGDLVERAASLVRSVTTKPPALASARSLSDPPCGSQGPLAGFLLGSTTTPRVAGFVTR